MDDLQKRSWAEISLENIRHNYNAIRASLPEGCRFLGVVKADAYGHGAVQVSHLLQDCGADYLAVSCLDEALELRRGGITMPILILGHTPPEYTSVLIENRITQTVSCYAKALEYSTAATALGAVLKIHIKLDTGMSRLGFLCAGEYFDEGVQNVIDACRLPGLEPEGVYTHFAVSDEEGEENEQYTREQFSLFRAVIDAVSERGGVAFRIRHCANSGAVVNYPEMALNMVREAVIDIQDQALTRELECIKGMRRAGELSPAHARDLRNDVYVQQMVEGCTSVNILLLLSTKTSVLPYSRSGARQTWPPSRCIISWLP